MSDQYRDPFDDRLPCATCAGTGMFGGRICLDCMGSGRCPAEHPPVYFPDPVQELDDEFEVDDQGQFRRIWER